MPRRRGVVGAAFWSTPAGGGRTDRSAADARLGLAVPFEVVVALVAAT